MSQKQPKSKAITMSLAMLKKRSDEYGKRVQEMQQNLGALQQHINKIADNIIATKGAKDGIDILIAEMTNPAGGPDEKPEQAPTKAS
jgi:septal ring factor EnvC (AmiA/AmiB activator)